MSLKENVLSIYGSGEMDHNIVMAKTGCSISYAKRLKRTYLDSQGESRRSYNNGDIDSTSYAQIASELNVSPNTVRKIEREALSKMYKHLTLMGVTDEHLLLFEEYYDYKYMGE